MIRFVGYNGQGIFLDVYCKSGVIRIEAGLYSLGKSVWYYNKENFLFLRLKQFSDFDFETHFLGLDKKIKKNISGKIICMDGIFQSISASKKNAKIAGVQDVLHFSRTELDWLDSKFDKGSVGYIVSILPYTSNNISSKVIEKIYREFFYQSDFVLGKKGKICVATRDKKLLAQYADQFGFEIVEEHVVVQGMEEVLIFVLKRE